MKIYWQLFMAFMRVGGLTFGGGLAQLPMLKYEIVQRYGWLDEDELLDVYAIGQCTPGIIAVNTATSFPFASPSETRDGIRPIAAPAAPSAVSGTAMHCDVEKPNRRDNRPCTFSARAGSNAIPSYAAPV